MDAKRAQEIADRLHAKWVSDPQNDGEYVLKLNAEETAELFRDFARELHLIRSTD